MKTEEKPKKTEKQEKAEQLAKDASENVRLAQKIMANMTRRKRVNLQTQPNIAYERR